MDNVPPISVVIPVRNEAAKIKACIEGILAQSVSVHEIIVLDSGSTDGTLEILAQYPSVRVVPIEPSDFNHGETRNVGVREAEGAAFVLLTVGDARPVDDRWIERLLNGFSDERVAGVCGKQVIPHEKEANPVEWFRPVGTPNVHRYVFDTPEAFDALRPERKREICAWDDVTAMYRRDVLLKIPFEPVTYGEDTVWAHAALRAGYALVYDEHAQVYHYHVESPDYVFKRTLTSCYFRYRQFSVVPGVPSRFGNLLSAIKILVREPRLSFSERIYWLGYNVRKQRALRKAAQAFLGAMREGDAALDALHQRFCGKPPIPSKQARV